jgi:nicotinate-nucleotide adenylyltransferase
METKDMKKVGILGGTFNPVHRGHIELGLQIQQAFQMEKILYILSAHPPHKTNLKVVPMALRWKMLERALKPFPQLVPCDLEMKRPTKSWTIDTIKELKIKYPGTQFYFISGSEGFLRIRTWKDYKTLLHSLPFIVVLRNPEHRQAVEHLLKEEDFPRNTTTSSIHIFSYESDKLAISSTLIREKIKQSQQIDRFVEGEVKKIMEDNKLYES